MVTRFRASLEYGEETRVTAGIDAPAPEPKLIGVRDSD